MATRFYLYNIAVLDVAPAADASWEIATTPFRNLMGTERRGTAFFTSAKAETSSAEVDVLHGQFISRPLRGAQTISGFAKAIVRAMESSTNANFRAQLLIKVVSHDGGTVRGTLLAHDTGSIQSEFDAATLTNRKFPVNWSGSGGALSSVVAEDGDRIVVEIGYRAHNTASTSYTSTLEFGDASDTLLFVNELSTTQYTPWLEFSQSLYFYDGRTEPRERLAEVSSANNMRFPSAKSVNFGGTDEYADAGNVLSLEITYELSVSFWFKCNSAIDIVFLGRWDSSAQRGYGVYMNSNGTLGIEFSETRGDDAVWRWETSYGYNDGTWHLCVWTYTGGSFTCYIDGTSVPIADVSPGTCTTMVSASATFKLGKYSDFYNTYVGLLDEVLVYEGVLGIEDIANLVRGCDPLSMLSPCSILAYWKMGDGDTYPVLQDSGPGSFDATMTNMEAGDIVSDVPTLGYWDPESTYAGVTQSADVAHTPPETLSVPVPDSEQVPLALGQVHYYKMRAQDSGATPPGYVTWVVSGEPDFAGSGYSGGTPTPIGAMVPGSVVLADEWRNS